MKNKCFLVFICLLCIAKNLPAQNVSKSKTEELRKEMWETTDPAFKITEVPEKWKNESAVVLAQYTAYEYKKAVMTNFLYQNEYFHRRIKLLDKASVEDYSEFELPQDIYSQIYFYVGIKIIKPNKKESEVNLSQAVKLEQKAGSRKANYKKLAIPNLEPGDILDYFICSEATFITGYQSFEPVIYTLTAKYPFLYQKIDFDVLRKCSINFKSMNGAPELKVDDDSKNDKKHFTLIDRNRDKTIIKNWFYPYRSVPTIKFQAYYGGGTFAGEPGTAKKSISNEEIIKFLGYFNGVAGDVDIKTIEKNMTAYFKTEKDPVQKAQHAYFVLRNGYLTKKIEQAFVFNEDIPENHVSSAHFADVMHGYLKKDKIDHNICIAIPRHISNLEDFIFSAEISCFVKVNAGKETQYIFKPDYYKNWNEIPPDFQGVDFYYLDKTSNLKKGTLPVLTAEANHSLQKMNISFDKENMSALLISHNVNLKGANRSGYQEQLVNPEEVVAEENKIYVVAPIEQGLDKKTLKKLPEMRENARTQYKKNIEEALKKDFENDDKNIKVNEVSNFKVIQNGRMPQTPVFQYSYDVKAEGFVKKIGTDYILEAGKFIGGQLTLEKQDMTREYDVYMPYARSYEYEINIQLPDGYSVQGLDKLENNVSNETGSFISKAVQNGKTLLITVKKSYTHNYEKAQDWSKMVAFIEAAYNFTQQKLLLKHEN